MKELTNIVDAPLHNEESDYHFVDGPYFSIQFKILAASLLVFGGQLLLSLNVIGVLLILLALLIFLAKKELTISFSLSKYRFALKIFNLRMGEWKSLPAFESVSIFNAKKSQVMSSGPQTGTATFSELEVNLVYNRSRRLTAYTTKDYNKALRVARIFAQKFEMGIYDASTRDAHWLE